LRSPKEGQCLQRKGRIAHFIQSGEFQEADESSLPKELVFLRRGKRTALSKNWGDGPGFFTEKEGIGAVAQKKRGGEKTNREDGSRIGMARIAHGEQREKQHEPKPGPPSISDAQTRVVEGKKKWLFCMGTHSFSHWKKQLIGRLRRGDRSARRLLQKKERTLPKTRKPPDFQEKKTLTERGKDTEKRRLFKLQPSTPKTLERRGRIYLIRERI